MMRLRGHLVFLLPWILLVGVLCRLEPPPALWGGKDEALFDAGRAEALLRVLIPEERPRPVGSAEHQEMVRRLVAVLEGMGLKPRVWRGSMQATPDTWVWLSNVMARIDGEREGPALLLVAHHDSVGAGPGVADNGVSMVAMLEAARRLQMGPRPRNPVILLFPDAEELGLLGSQAFLDGDPWAESVGFVLNGDAAGSWGRSMLFETGSDSGFVVDLYASSAPHPDTSSLHAEVYRRFMGARTDLSPFLERGLRGANFANVGGQWGTAQVARQSGCVTG
jgi:hypothetical protein